MGSSPSTIERLEVPLYAQANPFLATDNGVVSEKATSLRIKPVSIRRDIDVFDSHSNELMFQSKMHSFSSRRSLETPNGRELMSMKGLMFSCTERVFDGNQTETESYRIGFEYHSSTPSVIFADFHDRLSGDACRMIVEGNSYDDVVIVYLERGRTKLPPLDKRDDRTSSRFQAVGRIYQASKGSFRSHEYYVEAAPGVDITVMLMLWRVRYEMEHRRQED